MGLLAYQLSAVGLLCLFARQTAAQTEEPEWAPTGKLNQFRGFATPRPLPANAEFIYTSVWAAWSGWSYCSNGVRIRVRACNTVRGYNCLGPRKEFMPCGLDHRKHDRRPVQFTDYDVTDPHEEDRLEAMRQLYPDEFYSAQRQRENPNFVKVPKSASEPLRALAAEPIRERQPVDENEVKNINRVAPPPQPPAYPTNDEEKRSAHAHKKNYEPPAYPPALPSKDEKRPKEQLVSNKNYRQIAPPPPQPIGDERRPVEWTPNENSGVAPPHNQAAHHVAPQHVATTPAPSVHLARVSDPHQRNGQNNYRNPNVHFRPPVEEEELLEEPNDVNTDHAADLPALLSKEKHPEATVPRQYAVKVAPSDKDRESPFLLDLEEQAQLHREEVEEALNSLRLREVGKSSLDTPKQVDVRVWHLSELEEPKKRRGSNDFSKWHKNAEHKEKTASSTEARKKIKGTAIEDVVEASEDQDDKSLVADEKLVTEEKSKHPSTTTESTTTASTKDETFDDEEHFEQFGTRPQVVKPKKSLNEGEDVVPEVVVPVMTEPLPATTTESFTIVTPTTLAATTTKKLNSLPKDLSNAQKDLIDQVALLMESKNPPIHKVNKGDYGFSKAIPENAVKKKKTKGFGFTGFFVRKNQITAKKNTIHEGDVTVRQLPLTTTVYTTRTTSIPPTTTREQILEEELSPDTVHALDWMLQNITKIAEKGDEAFMKALKTSDAMPDTADAAAEVDLFSAPVKVINEAVPAQLKSQKRLKKKKSKKGRRNGMSKKRVPKSEKKPFVVHSGEFKPTHIDRSKMFPKFKNTITISSRARSFGVRTVNEDKDEAQWEREAINEALEEAAQKALDQKEKANGDPAKLIAELEALQKVMNEMEKQMSQIEMKDSKTMKPDTTTPSSFSIKVDKSAMDLSLVPSQSGFITGSSQEQFHQQPMHIITEGAATSEATHWSDWGSWAECFCGKQVRTRRCVYTDAMSSGCQGNAFESRDCTGGWCPVSTDATRPEVTTTTQPEEPPQNPKDPRRSFRPLQLHTAIPHTQVSASGMKAVYSCPPSQFINTATDGDPSSEKSPISRGIRATQNGLDLWEASFIAGA